MADKKISEGNKRSAAELTGTDRIPLVVPGSTNNFYVEYGDLQCQWSPVFVSEAGDGKTMKKLVAYAGGTGDMPTDHIGEYLTANGGFTNDPAEAWDFPDSMYLEYNDDFEI
ncbi:MAG: hypothetical protein QM594_02530 [Niabella sp.]